MWKGRKRDPGTEDNEMIVRAQYESICLDKESILNKLHSLLKLLYSIEQKNIGSVQLFQATQ